MSSNEKKRNTVSLEIEFSQTKDKTSNGEISLTLGGEVQTRVASGRLDSIGDYVTADGFVYAPSETVVYDVTIECTRKSASLMDVNFIFAGPPESFYENPQSNQNDNDSTSIKIEKLLPDVLIKFDT